MDTPRVRVREELKGLAMYARSKPSPELVEEDIGIRLDRIIAALTTPADGCEGCADLSCGGTCCRPVKPEEQACRRWFQDFPDHYRPKEGDTCEE